MRKSKHLALIAIIFCSIVSFADSGVLRQIAALDLPGTPGFDDMVFANGYLVITQNGANTVDIYDPVKRHLVAQVKGIDDPRGMAVDAKRGLVYVAGHNSITTISSKDWRVLGVIGLQHSAVNLLLVPSMQSLLISSPSSRSVSIVSTDAAQTISPNKPAELATFDVQGRPREMAWDPQRKVAYVAIEDTDEILTLDPANPSHPIVGRTKLAASQPTALLFEPNSRRLFVAVRFAVLQLNADTGVETGRVAAPAGVDSLWLDVSTNNLIAASADGAVTAINVGASQIESRAEYKGDVRGHALAYDPGNHLIFLSGGHEGKSKLVVIRNLGTAPAVDTVAAKR